jgi:hypothetical protein
VSDAGAAEPRTLPGWGLRLALLAASAIAIGVAMAGTPDIGVVSLAGVVMMLLVVGTALAPGSVVPLLLLIGLVLYRLLSAGPALDLGLAALVLLMPLIHQLSGIAAAIPVRSRCEWRVLRPAAIRFACAVLPVEVALAAASLIA